MNRVVYELNGDKTIYFVLGKEACINYKDTAVFSTGIESSTEDRYVILLKRTWFVIRRGQTYTM